MEVPVGFIEAEAVAEELQGGGLDRGLVGGAVLGRDIESHGEGRQISRTSWSVAGGDGVREAGSSIAIWKGVREGFDQCGDIRDGYGDEEGCAVLSGMRSDHGHS